ncbi:MAG: LacI family DNA-binding transcriptional regulator [Actinocatenispora sp.]
MTTIYDVARAAEVSPATVSRVLNGKQTVDDELAERVRDAARQLDYRPNAVARNLRRSRTSLWAVIISDINNPFFTALVRGVEDVAQSAQYSVVLCNADENPDKEASYISAVLSEQMAGVIISPTHLSTHIGRLLGAHAPVVAIDREVDGAAIDTVLVDNEHGARLATAHLIEQGYQRVACITGPHEVTTASERLRGYQAALRDAGRTVDPGLVRYANFREAGGHAAMTDLLDSGARPDAVFAGNNLMTVGALECLAERGLAVPSEVAVVGFDDVPWAGFLRPPLSTVSQPTYELGRTAANLLLQRIADPGRPASRITLHTELHVRGSSRR